MEMCWVFLVSTISTKEMVLTRHHLFEARIQNSTKNNEKSCECSKANIKKKNFDHLVGIKASLSHNHLTGKRAQQEPQTLRGRDARHSSSLQHPLR